MERAIRLLGVVYQHPAAEQQEICSKRWMDSAYKGHWYRMAESLGASGGWGWGAGTTPGAEAGDAHPILQMCVGQGAGMLPVLALSGRVGVPYWRQRGGWALNPTPGGTPRGSMAPMAGNAIRAGKAAHAVGTLPLPCLWL